MSQLAGYIGPISTAMWVFPFVALLFTVPYVLSSYHRYGAVLFFRALVVYSFIFYLMCVYFLAILPLPSIEEVARETKPWAQLKPFAGLQSALRGGGISSAGDPQTWLRVLGTDSFFYLAANVAMLFPLGIYLRYYFRQGFFGTVRWGFLVSLSLELLQLTGLLFIYPRPYRLFDVDDLITNTLGAALGYLVAPLPMKILPSQERLDHVAYRRGERVSIFRAAVAAGVDWALCALDRRACLGRAGRAQRQAHPLYLHRQRACLLHLHPVPDRRAHAGQGALPRAAGARGRGQAEVLAGGGALHIALPHFAGRALGGL